GSGPGPPISPIAVGRSLRLSRPMTATSRSPRTRTRRTRTMATMASPTTTRSRRAAHASSVTSVRRNDQDGEYDLLTAALMGMAVGAGITYMLRRGPAGRRPIAPLLGGTGRGLAWMGKHAATAGRAGASWAGAQGAELWDRVPREEIRRNVE